VWLAAAMEKYRQFGDAGTGVHPFTPAWSHHKTPLALRLLKALVLPIALLRMLFLGVALLWLALSEAVCMLIPIGALKRPVHRLLTYVGCTFACIALGIASTQDELADHRRLKLLPPKTSSKVFNAKRGTLIFVNHSGLCDVLVCGLKLSPVFVFPASDGTPVQYSLLGALRRAASCKKEVASSKESLKTIAAAAKSSWQPVVVFAEGMRTVGNCVLAWKDETFEGLESLSADSAIMSFQYSNTGAYTPHHTVGTGLAHIFWLTMQLQLHTVKSVWLPASDLSIALKGKPMDEQTGLLRTILVRMIKDAKEVSVGADRHHDFMEFWNDAQKKGYTKKRS